MRVQERLTSLMQERNWTTNRLARESGVSRTTIQGILAGTTEPTVRTLEKICTGIKIPIHQFFDAIPGSGLTDEQRKLLFRWSCLRESDQRLLSELIDTLIERS